MSFLTNRSVVDTRLLLSRDRLPRIFDAFDQLPESGAIEVIFDHDPKTLLYRLQNDRTGAFEWSPLQEGTDVWRVEIVRRSAILSRERRVTEYHAWDHDRLDAIYRDLHKDIAAALWPEATRRFVEFRTGLERHMRMEEEILFPEMERRQCPEKPNPIPELREEHEQVRQLMAWIQELLTSEGELRSHSYTKVNIDALGALLTNHGRREDRVLHVDLDEVLDAKGRDSFVRAMQSV